MPRACQQVREADLHELLPLPQPEQADDGVLALGPDAGVLVLGVVQQTLQERLDKAGVQGGCGRVFPHPPQHALRHQTDVAGLVLQTLRVGRRGPLSNLP